MMGSLSSYRDVAIDHPPVVAWQQDDVPIRSCAPVDDTPDPMRPVVSHTTAQHKLVGIAQLPVRIARLDRSRQQVEIGKCTAAPMKEFRPTTHICRQVFWAIMPFSMIVVMNNAARKGRNVPSPTTDSISCSPATR